MKAMIGVVSSAKQECVEPSKQIKCLRNMFAMNYQGTAHRLTSAIDVSECIDDAELYRIDKALWDTGSDTCCISEKLARQIGLHPIDSVVCVTSTGQTELNYYLVDVSISRDIVFHNVRVTGFPLERHSVDFLIGMDIMSKGNFNMMNEAGKTTITFSTIGSYNE